MGETRRRLPRRAVLMIGVLIGVCIGFFVRSLAEPSPGDGDSPNSGREERLLTWRRLPHVVELDSVPEATRARSGKTVVIEGFLALPAMHAKGVRFEIQGYSPGISLGESAATVYVELPEGSSPIVLTNRPVRVEGEFVVEPVYATGKIVMTMYTVKNATVSAL